MVLKLKFRGPIYFMLFLFSFHTLYNSVSKIITIKAKIVHAKVVVPLLSHFYFKAIL